MAALAEDDVDDAPRGSQSVRDKKHYEKQKARRATQEMCTLNFADEIIYLHMQLLILKFHSSRPTHKLHHFIVISILNSLIFASHVGSLRVATGVSRGM